MSSASLMGIDEGQQGLQNLGLVQTRTSQDSSYHNQNLLVNITPNHFKSISRYFGYQTHFLEPNTD